ncbi:hypothetical protein Prudu_021669 [Prunus dulcis]|uniref:Ankyrin repeat family protein n=1 Tax=Prunus dulcis TaxID=3755 RepID=A0A4Y1RXV7_PRUDU|nr:hypothetical protein Prudu_021669 [Prunus dulcis]
MLKIRFRLWRFGVISVRSSGGIISRRWIQNPNRCADEYLDGIEDFIEFARRHNPGATRIRCPCRRCNNTLWETIENDAFPFASTNINHEREDDVPTPIDSAEFEQYEKLLKNANQDIPGVRELFRSHGHCRANARKNKVSYVEPVFRLLFGGFQEMLRRTIVCRKTINTQKVLNGLGLGYEKIHACKNNCMLFYKEHETLDTCPICNESRFKMTSQNRTTKIPQKSCIVYVDAYCHRHEMHKEKRVDDDVMRHPADGEAWKEFDRTFPSLLLIPEIICNGFWVEHKGLYGMYASKEDVTSGWYAGKVCYLGHRRWLPWDHEWREKDKEFDGNTESRLRPREWSGDEILEQLNRLDFAPSEKQLFPDGYASNIARCVNVDGCKFTRLKSHDCHVFMQRLRPVGIRHLLPEDVVKPIMLLSRFFSQLTAKTLRKTDMFQLRHDIVQVLCKFDMIFPPAFFTSMMHVMVHLPEEALLAGPASRRAEKSVRNRAKPEGSIIEAWVQYESLTFCGMYLKDVETAFNRPQRNNDGGMRKKKLSVFAQRAQPFGDPR